MPADSASQPNSLSRYAFISHESAIEANWAIARLRQGTQGRSFDDGGVYLIPAPDSCVCTQRQAAELVEGPLLQAWGVGKGPIHMLVPSASSRSRGRTAEFHVWSGPFPDHAFFRVNERVFVSTPLFTVLQLALLKRPNRLGRQRAAESAAEELRLREDLGLPADDVSAETLLAWEAIRQRVVAAKTLTDFAGTYWLPCRADGETLYGVKPLATRAELRAFANEFIGRGTVRGRAGAREAVGLSFDASGSPMETALALLLTLPVEMGGYGLPRPQLNWRIPVAPEDREVTRAQELFADLCWPDARLVVEYDSEAFHPSSDAAKRLRDRERANSLTALGWKVLSVGRGNIASVQSSSLLARQIARVLGVGLRTPAPTERLFRSRLHALLLPPRKKA